MSQPKVKSECWMCHTPLPVPTFTDLIELEQNYREFYAENWMDDRPVRVCVPCFRIINDLDEEDDDV